MRLRNLAIIWFILFPSFLVEAASKDSSQQYFHVNPFAQNYLTAGIINNYPMTFSQNDFVSGGAHPIIGYRYNLHGDWILGVSGSFKMLKIKKNGDMLPLFTLTHESLYVIRLYHPYYLMVGPKLLYFYPLKSAKLPFQKYVGYDSQFGVAASLLLGRIISDRIWVNFRADRWRGTGTNKFHAIEVSFEINYMLSDRS